MHQALSARLRFCGETTRGLLAGRASYDSKKNWASLRRLGIEHHISESLTLERTASYTDEDQIIVEVFNARIGVL